MDNEIRVGDKVRRSYFDLENNDIVVLNDTYTVTKVEEFDGLYGPTTRYHTEEGIVLSDMTCTKIASLK